MNLHDTIVYLYKCERCAAAFVLTYAECWEPGSPKWDVLVNNLCQACQKGRIEYLGEVGIMTRNASSPTR